MTPDPTALTDEQIRERIAVLYPLTETAGCPRKVTLEYFALSDEEDRRRPPRAFDIGCMVWDETLERELEGHLEQP